MRAWTSPRTARPIWRRSRARSEAAQNAVAEAEAATLRAEVAHSAARQGLDVARGPLAEAERRVGRLETEAKALAKVLDVEAQKLWPPVIDLLTVEKGFETALGAALGDDLDAPIDPASPIRWAGAAADAADPALPEGAEPLARHVTAPPELARRLAQIGVVDRALGRALVAAVASPASGWSRARATCGAGTALPPRSNAPTAAARRLAAKNRLADLDAELGARAPDVEGKAPRRRSGRSRARRGGRGRGRSAQCAARGAGASRGGARRARRRRARGEPR